MSLRKKINSSIRWTALDSASITIIQFVQLGILGRILPPSIFGVMAMLMIVIETAKVFSQMGLSEAIISKQSISKDQLSSLYWINVFAGIILYSILVLGSSSVASFFSEPQLKIMLPVVGFVFIMSAFSLQFEALIRKKLLFDLFAKINIAASVSSLIITVSLALQGFGIWSLVYGQFGSQVIRTLALVRVAKSNYWLPAMHFQFDEIREHFYFGLHRVGAMIVNQFNSRVDQLVIAKFLGPIPLGFYNIAFRIALNPTQRINPIITQVAFPVFSQMQENNIKLRGGFVKMIHLLTSINAPLLIGLSAVAPVVVPLLMGDQWTSSIAIVQVLAFYALFRSLGNAGGSLILAKGKANWTLYWNLALLFLIPGAVILAILIEKSVLIVSLVLVVLQLALVVIHYFVFLRRLIGPFAKMYAAAIIKPITAASIMGIAVYYFQSLLLHAQIHLLLNLIFSVVLGAFIYVSISYLIQRPLFAAYWQILPDHVQNMLFLYKKRVWRREKGKKG